MGLNRSCRLSRLPDPPSLGVIVIIATLAPLVCSSCVAEYPVEIPKYAKASPTDKVAIRSPVPIITEQTGLPLKRGRTPQWRCIRRLEQVFQRLLPAACQRNSNAIPVPC